MHPNPVRDCFVYSNKLRNTCICEEEGFQIRHNVHGGSRQKYRNEQRFAARLKQWRLDGMKHFHSLELPTIESVLPINMHIYIFFLLLCKSTLIQYAFVLF